MSEELLVAGPTTVKHKGVFDLDEFYKFLHDLLDSLGYSIEERKYKQKDVPGGKEVEISWECTKKVDDYTMFRINIDITIKSLVDVQVQRGDIRVPAHKGDMEFKLKGWIITDYEDKWEKSPILKFLKGIYDRYLYKPTFENLQKKVWEESYTVENEVKAFLNLPRFL